MKKILSFVVGLLFSFTAFAQNWDTVVITGAAIGTFVSTEYAFYQSLIRRELKGWAQKGTGTSVRLENQCGIETEFHMIGDYKRNYIMVGISNNSGKQVAMNFRKVKYKINKTTERYPGYSYQVADELVNSGWWIVANIPLPKKDELATYDHIEVDIPIVKAGDKEACHIVTEFSRTSHVAKEETSYNFFEFLFESGPSIAQSGNVSRLGDPDWNWGMTFNWFFSANHGAGMSFLWENGYDNTRTTYDGNIFSGDFHYSYRKFLSNKFTMNFEPGIGWQGLYNDYNCNSCGNYDYDSTFMVDYRLMLQYIVGEWNIAEIEVMNFVLGGGLVHQYGFSGDSSGSRYALLFRFGFGF